MPELRRVLIANRGEIAIRIARAAAGIGMESVAVYAPVDRASLHTRIATTAVEIHGASADDAVGAYLNAPALIETAIAQGCDCVHPGYGFLAENAQFAKDCADAGLTFTGPPPAALRLFGDKVQARALAQSLDIPVIPGSAALQSLPQAREAASSIGYPAMLKAAAGGGGRGMRVVERVEDLEAAFQRCGSEAEAAFGDGSLFLERLISRPRHIEAQILADGRGQAIHLHERDCSVQLRNQKVLEVAPAPALPESLRDGLLADAVKLVAAAGYAGVGTVEFLVLPERGERFFIECNPRIQVEHTVTEQVLGIDLVEAQFRIAAGASLADVGFDDQGAVPAPRGYAVQARVVARGAGALRAYKEPSGAGVRVDACGYAGYAPPPQFDPLLAKVIAWSPAPSLEAAAGRAAQALAEFHIGGVATNLAMLQALLADADFLAGNARTSLLAEKPELLAATDGTADGGVLALLQQASGAAHREGAAAAPRPERAKAAPPLEVASDQRAVICPMDGTVIEMPALAGATVAAGEPLLVVSAMKMETVVAAPCAGTVAIVAALQTGDAVVAGQTVAALYPAAAGPSAGRTERGEHTWAALLEDVNAMRRLADERLAPDSEDPGAVRQRSRGKLTCRERIDLLLDAGSFREVGSVAGFATYDDSGKVAAFTPANHVGGWGKVEGRSTVVCADDFTSRGGHADGAIGEKSRYLDRLALELRMPSVRLLDGSSGGGSIAAMVPAQKQAGESQARESAGAITAGRPRVAGGGGSFLPGELGSTLYAEQLCTVPVVNVLLGSVVGIGAAKAVLGHFSVMVRDIAQLFVAGPPVVRHAMGYEITKEDLGGWHIHCRNGSVDNLAETEEDAAAQTRRFLSYLPPSVFEAPPRHPPHPDDPPDRREEELFTLVPRKRTTTFDMRRAIALMLDKGSLFEIGTLWGTDQITGFARVNGYPVGVIASDSQHANSGALTADGCSKLKRHLDLCDLFHLPIVSLVDNPGFAVGLEHETAGTIRRGGEWMVAFAQTSVPIFTVLMRRSFGVAGNNYATPRARPSMRVAWPSADVGGIPPEGGIEAAYKRQLAEAEDPAAFREELMARIESVRGPVGPLSKFQLEELIDPRDTRRCLSEWVELAYRLSVQPAKLRPRALQFRP